MQQLKRSVGPVVRVSGKLRSLESVSPLRICVIYQISNSYVPFERRTVDAQFSENEGYIAN